MKKLQRTYFIAGLSGVFVCVGSVYAAQAPVVDITSSGARVRGGPTMDERITKLESVLENRTLEEFAARIDSLQQDLQRLQGDEETVNHNIEDLKRKQRELYLDLDHRLRTLETAQRSSNGSGNEVAPNAAAAGADERASYDAAFATLRDGKYEQAIVELQDF
jgi:TolA-binding protein